MCGIFSYFGNSVDYYTLYANFCKIKHRGPDKSRFLSLSYAQGVEFVFGFHRLAINGIEDGDQPMQIDDRYLLICNGEIYNYKEIANKYNFKLKTKSDCEIIIHLFKRNNSISSILNELNGEFAFVLLDSFQEKIYICRDHLGIRSLYYTINENGTEFGVASESKALLFSQYKIQQFPPGSYMEYNIEKRTSSISTYYYPKYEIKQKTKERDLLIKNSLIESVRIRLLHSERPVGCLLSGGLDSSIITSIASQIAKKDGLPAIRTFSIGLENSPDLKYAKIVSEYLGTEHHSVVVSEKDFVDILPEVIYTLGSSDITTIRASIGNYLIAKYISENTDIKVLLTGECADELSGSYLYFQNAPNSYDFLTECERLLHDICYFDVKRCDACITAHGLEARVPFADKQFMTHYMSVNPEEKMFDGIVNIEKELLRNLFADYLPKSIIDRRKNGFSNSVSNKNRDLSDIIKEYTSKQHNCTESGYYKSILFKYYKNHTKDNLTPYQWLPKWSGNIKDPSARCLDIYNAD